MSERVIADYLTFTFRPDMTESVELISFLDKRHKAGEGALDSRAFYKALVQQGKVKFDNNLKGWVTQIFGRLQKIVSSLEFNLREYGYSGYTNSIDLYRDGQHAGLIAWGGSNANVMVSLSGIGMAQTSLIKFHRLLLSLPFVKITRIDLAYDCFSGERGFDWAEIQFREGGFNAGGRDPKCAKFMSGGERPENPGDEIIYSGGRTFQVGNRANGKLYRGYEKGLQLLGEGVSVAESTKNWFRHEVEIHSTKRDIPLEVLLKPAHYLAGTYPCLAFVSEQSEKIKIKNQVAKITLGELVKHCRESYGNLVSFLKDDLQWSDAQVVESMMSKHARPPRRLMRLLHLNVA